MKTNILYKESTDLIKQIFSVTWTLFRIMIPILIIIKILEELGAIVWFGEVLSPIMMLVGLPGETAIIWATTIATSIYGGMIVFFSSPYADTLTVSQVSVLAGMMLFSHGLPIEGSIAKRAGVSWLVTILLRCGGAIVYGMLLHYIYQSGDWLQQINQLTYTPDAIDNGWISWGKSQLKNLFIVFIIISALLTLLRILRYLHIERLLGIILQPALKLLGISKEATYIVIIGLTLGLSFGGGILIKEADSGKLSKSDVFAAITFLSISHSLIEDTILVMLLGAHISAVLWIKLVFSIIIIALLSRWANKRSDTFKRRFLIK